jgi:sterol desaturase/sphingolipid hydroxylase (fatty acid hydroxylase superfamily)
LALALAPVSKMTNAMVEVGLIFVSLVLGIMGLSAWAIVVMVGIGLSWWAFVHRGRIAQRLKASVAKSVGQFAVVLVAVICGHFVAFVLVLRSMR